MSHEKAIVSFQKDSHCRKMIYLLHRQVASSSLSFWRLEICSFVRLADFGCRVSTLAFLERRIPQSCRAARRQRTRSPTVLQRINRGLPFSAGCSFVTRTLLIASVRYEFHHDDDPSRSTCLYRRVILDYNTKLETGGSTLFYYHSCAGRW
jgi:hypothetical protein